MNDQPQIKQRLIGAIVLAALGIIFIPMILDNEADDFLVNGSSIPPKPEHITEISKVEIKPTSQPVVASEERIPVDEKTDKGVTDPAKVDANKTAPLAGTIEKNKDIEKAIIDSTKDKISPVTTPRAWAVQVGSFGDSSNAIRLRDKLRKSSYTVFVDKITVKNTTVYRVRVGPFIKRDLADAVSQELGNKHKIKALVVSHP